MNDDVVKLVAELRLVVGFLGEKAQSDWWGSNFLGGTSGAFLAPVFSRTTMLARYHGVCEAATIVHDEHIGLGENFHLYRLPDAIERAVAQEVAGLEEKRLLNSVLCSSSAVLDRLKTLADGQEQKVEGPVVLGSYSDVNLDATMRQSAQHYLMAFTQGYKCFPYLREAT